MKPSLTLKFWGVRGSIPSPGLKTLRYGGNTTCLSLKVGFDKVIVFDAGTGIRELGKRLAGGNEEIFILLSHFHWDHIQGFPFFIPIYEPGRKIHIAPTEKEKRMICSLIDQMDGAHFPVSSKDLPSFHICAQEDLTKYLKAYGFDVSWIKTNHPGGGYGYCLKDHGRSIIYLTDNELFPPHKKNTEFDEFVKFCKNAHILIHDAQYLGKDLPCKHGWGHSLVNQVLQLGAMARVKHLILTHHDPDRSDEELDEIQRWSQEWLNSSGYAIKCTVASEGLTIKI